MLMLGPIIMFGMASIISGMTEKYVKQASAFGKISAVAEQALSSIRIVVAFGMESTELQIFKDGIKEYGEITQESSLKSCKAFGILYFCIYFSYSYAFCLGAFWIDWDMWNHAMDREYLPGDIIAVFFGLLFAMFGLAGLGPNI